MLLSEILDDTIWLHKHPDFPCGVVIDEKHRAFFNAVKLSLEQLMAKIHQIELINVDEDDDQEAFA